jgi:hypothetical protein
VLLLLCGSKHRSGSFLAAFAATAAAAAQWAAASGSLPPPQQQPLQNNLSVSRVHPLPTVDLPKLDAPASPTATTKT